MAPGRSELERRYVKTTSRQWDQLRPLVESCANAAGGTRSRHWGRRLTVAVGPEPCFLPARAMAGIPIEALLAREDERTMSHAPSATAFKSLPSKPRAGQATRFARPWATLTQGAPDAVEPKPLPD